MTIGKLPPKVTTSTGATTQIAPPAVVDAPPPPPVVEAPHVDAARVGLDPARRDAIAGGPSLNVRGALLQQVAWSRAAPTVDDVAATLDPAQVLAQAKLLGSGTFGATYDLGTGFVAKHLGDDKCVMGAMRDKVGADVFTQSARRQVAVHAALVAAGFSCVAAAHVPGHDDWVVMQKAQGLSFGELLPAEQVEADAACAQVRDAIKDVLNDALRKAGFDVGDDGIDTDVHVENARFARTPAGIQVAAFFDPTV